VITTFAPYERMEKGIPLLTLSAMVLLARSGGSMGKESAPKTLQASKNHRAQAGMARIEDQLGEFTQMWLT